MAYNILVVDDDKNMALNLGDLLRLIGHNPELAYGPRSALVQIEASPS